jgi:TonB-linked SusC/RagA family outer membrane protein
MQLKVFCSLSKTLLAMKLLILLMTAACLQVAATGFGQTLTLSLRNVPLETAFKEIKQQTGYSFVYTRDQLKNSVPVSLDIQNGSLDFVLKSCFNDQPLSYSIEDKYIIVLTKPQDRSVQRKSVIGFTVTGRVINDHNDPVVGASVKIKSSGNGTTTDANGEFFLHEVNSSDVIVVSGAEMETTETRVGNRSFIEIKINATVGELDQVIMTAYGQTTKRMNTGNISKVSAEEIRRQPVSNPLAALAGRVPGLLITQANGYAGTRFTIQVRGQNSLVQGSEPYFIIDGIPFTDGNENINQASTATSISPFYAINPADIESIEILKDADATAIYGSRGANGVILITTKKGSAGKTKFEVNAYSGSSRISRSMNPLNTGQYVMMRKEAQLNDGIPATVANSSDIMVWDTTRYTDLKKLFIGNIAHTNDLQVAVSGGNNNTLFRIGAGLHRESTVLPTDLSDKRHSANFNLNHHSTDKKFNISLKTIYSAVSNNLPYKDLSSVVYSPPNIKLYDSLGKLNWEEGGIPFSSVLGSVDANPLAILKTKYNGEFQSINTNIQLSYALLKNLTAKISSGCNLIFGDETRMRPSESLDPFGAVLPSAFFANSQKRSWITEPQLEYSDKFWKGKFRLQAGATWQESISKTVSTDATNYTSDLLLNSISGAGNILTTNFYRQYRYNAFFGLANYNVSDKYILNISGRRDGSSRFGPDNRFNFFWAFGGAWIFSNEKLTAKWFPFLSFGKIRSSYGVTGNDQIGDYLFLDTWTAGSTQYLQSATLLPSALFNPVLAWEETKKFEIALELGILNNRIQLSSSYFRNRSGNQLINYSLPIQTGFGSVAKNFDALIQNKGFEFVLQTKNIVSAGFNWSSSVTLTIARNKLLQFPGLATSSYATDYVIGQPVSVKQLYHYLGVDPSTGIYTFSDIDRSGTYNRADRVVLLNTQPDCYGGFQNSLSYHSFQLDIFFEFRKQVGRNYLANLRVPGYRFANQPEVVLNRWTKPGDVTTVQKFTATTSTVAYRNANSYLGLSDAAYTDASFVRCKNLSFSYSVPSKFTKRFFIEHARLYLQAQNLFVITKYKGADPENQNLLVLPPLRTITAGIHFNF